MDESRFDLITQFPDWEEFEGLPIEPVSGKLKITSVKLEPSPDGQRVVVDIAITPTPERPNLEIVILDPDDRVVAEMLIVEVSSARQTVTLHLRPPDPSSKYTVKAGLFWEKELVDTCETELTWLRRVG